uniref:Uncharacterized protein n=1 Tax=Anguilla anguilla TaxID=7936 RepID=A0A0E9RY75_ANGAN
MFRLGLNEVEWCLCLVIVQNKNVEW